MIEIDGSEGGGQLLRAAVALSAITGNSIKVKNIRGAREQGGLKMQHLTGLLAAAEMCNAKVTGEKIGSTEITFNPGKIKGGKYKFDIKTAGSITLLLQTIIPIAAFANKKVEMEIIGGTDVAWSPTMAFFEAVFCRNLLDMGLKIESKVLKSGFFPEGGGRVVVNISPCKKLKPLIIKEQGELRRLDVWSFASKQLEKADVAERQMQGFESVFKRSIDCRDVQYVDSLSTGSSITAHIHCNSVIGTDKLGEKGKKAEQVGRECAEALLNEINSGATLDYRMTDQILIFLALAEGDSEFKTSRISNHIKSNVQVIEKFLPVKFEIKSTTISCKKIHT